ncbi:SDR family NAD(P)-dependent oxidoreductase [Nonomuraea sp. NPDC000554]|uniref:SDR family NAD(P)-dependent oxidoreductase n=1 Tax=Nonomuraea sp. NPDC000554 TaxID=3154259 RepID=UPI00332ABA52
MSPESDGRTALITGGGTGIGRATALALAARGCLVTVTGRPEATLHETVEEIEAVGGRARLLVADATDEESVRAAVEAAVGDTGRLDFRVNSAGDSGGDDLKPLADYPTEKFDRLVDIDLRGLFLSMKYELRQMREQGCGSIVNVGSGAGLVGVPGAAGYIAAKHGAVGLTKAAALDHAADGVRVNAVAPGLVGGTRIELT